MKEKGITLVALVVTIIVLIILAGISINLILGENGVVIKSKQAKENYQKGANEEQEELENAEMIMDKIATDKELRGISARDIANAENKAEYYGSILQGYQCAKDEAINSWKILYADNNNIYIIADNYIHYQDCPQSKTQRIYRHNSDYSVSFNDVIKDYRGSEDITNEKIKKLNRDYFSKYSSENNNMKAIAYLLDTEIWKEFQGEKAEYAIGSPTLELLLNSYSQKYNTNYKAQATSEKGYQISLDGGDNWKDFIDGAFDLEDSLYTIKSGETSLAESMWLASPSNYLQDGNGMLYVINTSIYQGPYTNYAKGTAGLRPVVCLESSVRLEKQANGIYKIK